MALSNELLSQFAKIVKPEKETNKEVTVYGTLGASKWNTYVQIDGSDILTPVYSTANASDGDRVTVMVKIIWQLSQVIYLTLRLPAEK